MLLWSPAGARPKVSGPKAPDQTHHTSTAGGGANTRGVQVGVHEPLSFYGHVHIADPMPVAEVPMWIWTSSSAICVLLLLLWVLHQRRFSVVAAQLRLMQRRCFSPPAALYMSLVYSFFPLSGAIAWLSLLEPRVGLLLSQLRSAWEVCCLHCFMLLMLHLMGGPETTLLLVQQQHLLPPSESNGKALDETKGVLIPTGVDWGGNRDRRELPTSLQTEQVDATPEGEIRDLGIRHERKTAVCCSLSQSISNSNSNSRGSSSSSNNNNNNNNSNNNSNNSSNNNDNSSNGFTGVHDSEHSATRLYRRGVSAPNVLDTAVALPTEAGGGIPAAKAVKGELELVMNGVRQGVCQNVACSCSDPAQPDSQDPAKATEAKTRGGFPGTSECIAEPATTSPESGVAAAYCVTGGIALGAPKNPHSPNCWCSVTTAAGQQKRIRWARVRRTKCFSSKCCQRYNKTVECSHCSGESRLSGSKCSNHRSNNLRNDKISGFTDSAEPQTYSIWRRCRERLHRQRLRLGAANNRRSSMPPFGPAVVASAKRSDEADRSPFEGDALLPLRNVAPAAAAAAPASPACAVDATGVTELQFQHQRQSHKSSERARTEGSDTIHVVEDREAVTAAVDAAAAADSASRRNIHPVVRSPSFASPTAAAGVRRQQQGHHKLQLQQQRNSALRLSVAEARALVSGAPVPGSTCSTTVTSHGSSPGALLALAQEDEQSGLSSRNIHRKATSLDMQVQSLPISTADAASQHEKKDNHRGATDRRIWFVPPLCCLAWNTEARHFSAWDLRMSYRCLLPFTVLKLLRVLLCYLLSTLMHMGNEREKAVAEARIPTGAPAAHEGGLSHHQVLQRLLQLCCFISLIVAMWGLAVVFVATRPLLKPFNIGWKFTCLKALVFFIQLLELGAEAVQPIARATVSDTDGDAAASAAAQRVYVFTFLELLGSAICAVMATWAYKPGDLIRAHQRLLLLQKKLPLGAVPVVEESGSCSTKYFHRRLISVPFTKLIAGARRCSCRCFRGATE
ncbi:hypothetical protein, conserved [Eimeria maxima]|uniref:Uncharacterized protein n=1 Tax=Eimeria maxima TaxID=5804 RepID=U6M989_EIMMA|nr:hypothetical protein, conserved [Eimeria maxima]CDJ59618.1 hypothetical protein, conserved [Eimeria maxima]